MKLIKGHTKNKLKDWTGKKWYHQRFDGSPYLIHMIAEAEIVTDEGIKQGGDFSVHYCFFEDGKADWYIELEDMRRIYTALILAGKKDPRLSFTLMKKWKAAESRFYEKCMEIEKTDLTKLSDEKLMKLHDEYLEIILHKNSSSSIIDGFALGTDEMIADMIKEVYEQSAIKERMRFSEVFSVLTAPIHMSFINEAEIELFKAALAVKNGRDEDQVLKKHQSRFFWIRNNYVDAKVLDVEYFKQEVDHLLSMNVDLEKDLKKIELTPVVNKKKKKEVMSHIELSDELKFMIETSENFTHWQDERKKGTFWTAHYATLILEEIGKRVNIPSIELKYMSPREVSHIFENTPSRKELQARRRSSVLFWDKEGHEVLVGKDADEIKKTILGDAKFEDIDDFRGLTACTGKVTGTVKVVRTSKEIGKVEKGDILVAVMTRPDYVPAMKKAAAIVTNEGGITCHAAIISRELGIPCIIGTKIATQVLKDGMQVEVNANHGWIRILK